MCMDGSWTGFATNAPTTGGNGKILVWFDGGGGCYDYTTCNNPQTENPHVTNKSFSQSDFNAGQSSKGDINATGLFTWSKASLNRGIFDRSPGTTNPFRNYTFVLVPYCTGDSHAGTKHDTTSNIVGRIPSGSYHVGATNAKLVYSSVLSSLPRPPQVTLAGGSAGGFGAYFIYYALRQMTPSSIPMTVISDSGPPLWTGTPGAPPNQNIWQRQGYFLQEQTQPNDGFVYGPGQESYTEDLAVDAYGSGPSTGLLPPGVTAYTPFGSRGPIYPTQSVFAKDLDVQPSTDKFGVIDGSDDWVYSWLIPMNSTASGKLPNILEGLNDLKTNVITSHSNARLWIVASTSPPPSSPACTPWPCSNLRPFNQHHGYLLDDVTVWSGSGVDTFLTSLQWMGITP